MRKDTVIGLAFAGVLGLVLALRLGGGGAGLSEERKAEIRKQRRTM